MAFFVMWYPFTCFYSRIEFWQKQARGLQKPFPLLQVTVILTKVIVHCRPFRFLRRERNLSTSSFRLEGFQRNSFPIDNGILHLDITFYTRKLTSSISLPFVTSLPEDDFVETIIPQKDDIFIQFKSSWNEMGEMARWDIHRRYNAAFCFSHGNR